MPKRNRTRQRRKAFLLDSNQAQQERNAPKTVRNRLLNVWFRLKFLRDITRLVTASRVMGLVVMSMAMFILFAVFSPYFELKQIVVSRDNPDIDVESIETALEDFYGQNLLFLSQEELVLVLKTEFPAFRKISVSEIWPSALTLKIELSPPALTLLNQANAEFRVISEDGVILSEKPNELLPLMKVFDYDLPLNLGQRFIRKELLDKVVLAEQIMVKQIKIPVTERHLYPTARELHLISDRGTAFWIDLQLEVEEQLKKIEYGTNRIGLFSKDIEHVDLRVPNQLYWK